ncbi:MAG TPA: hypothetical protein VHY08_05335 [Bacillota bacterium]|nr:hypothetical protein [Bacillota bacterium]
MMAFWRWLLIPLERLTPNFIKKMILYRLITVSAQALQSPVPDIKGLSAHELLESYAIFTGNAIKDRLSRNEACSDLQTKLYQNAFQEGQRLRYSFGLTDRNDAIGMMRFLYRIIEIKMEYVSKDDEIVISQCFFSRYYTGDVCKIMELLDRGLAAGLSGGGTLEFYERITDDCEFCRAFWRENSNNTI